MDTIFIKKYKNGYTVEIGFLESDEDELYLYKTKEELLAELPELIDKAEKLKAVQVADEEVKKPAVDSQPASPDQQAHA